MKERHDTPLATACATAGEHYVTGVDRMLAGRTGMVAAFAAAVRLAIEQRLPRYADPDTENHQ